jgi:hypothetical protein
MEDRVVNVGWSRDWLKLGWAGAHTDCTNEMFVRYEVSKHVIPAGESPPPAVARGPAQAAERTSKD